jgi:CrcB protein
MALKLLMVFLGGGCGATLRYLLSGWLNPESGFPLGTFGVNIIGCACLGFAATAFAGPVMIRPEFRIAIVIGLLGGFTTFSTFAWETVSFGRDGQYLLLAGNVVASNVVGLAAAWVGHKLAFAIYGA